MNQEFHAYIQAITGDECGKARVARLSALSRGLTQLVAFIAAVFESIGPYYCELRPMRRVRGAIEQCCKPKQAIGFHGLA